MLSNSITGKWYTKVIKKTLWKYQVHFCSISDPYSFFCIGVCNFSRILHFRNIVKYESIAEVQTKRIANIQLQTFKIRLPQFRNFSPDLGLDPLESEIICKRGRIRIWKIILEPDPDSALEPHPMWLLDPAPAPLQKIISNPNRSDWELWELGYPI